MQLQPTAAAKVVCALVSSLFAVPGLDWSVDLDHVEVFCGKGEVTLAELQEWGCHFGLLTSLHNNVHPYDYMFAVLHIYLTTNETSSAMIVNRWHVNANHP